MRKGLVIISFTLVSCMHAMENEYLTQLQNTEGFKSNIISSTELLLMENISSNLLAEKNTVNLEAFIQALQIRNEQIADTVRLKPFIITKITNLNTFLNSFSQEQQSQTVIPCEESICEIAAPIVPSQNNSLLEKIQAINARIAEERKKIEAKEFEIQNRTTTIEELSAKIEQTKQEQVEAIKAHETKIKHFQEEKEARRKSYDRLQAEKDALTKTLESYMKKSEQVTTDLENFSKSFEPSSNPSSELLQEVQPRKKSAKYYNPLTWHRVIIG